MSWIDTFVSHTSQTSSPEIFRKWAAISCIAAALERRVYVVTAGSKLFPNLYTILCAPPGVGKTEVTWRVRELLKSLEDLHLSPASVTKASLIDELNESDRKIVKPELVPAVTSFNSLMICINELGVLIPAYDNEFMNTLTDLYDCKQYGEKRRTSRIEIQIDNPQINLLGACTPAYLNHTLPEGAWDQGFMSRTIVVYAGDRVVRSLFGDYSANEEERVYLEEELAQIFELFGEISFDEKAKQAIDNWYLSGCPPVPDHPKLVSYAQRRIVHVLKLCMVSVADRKAKQITVGDFERALGWLFEVETYMPEVFKAMQTGGPGRIIEEAWHFVSLEYLKTNAPVHESALMRWLGDRVPAHQVLQTIDLMERGKVIQSQLTVNGKGYKPLGKPKG